MQAEYMISWTGLTTCTGIQTYKAPLSVSDLPRFIRSVAERLQFKHKSNYLYNLIQICTCVQRYFRAVYQGSDFVAWDWNRLNFWWWKGGGIMANHQDVESYARMRGVEKEAAQLCESAAKKPDFDRRTAHSTNKTSNPSAKRPNLKERPHI